MNSILTWSKPILGYRKLEAASLLSRPVSPTMSRLVSGSLYSVAWTVKERGFLQGVHRRTAKHDPSWSSQETVPFYFLFYVKIISLCTVRYSIYLPTYLFVFSFWNDPLIMYNRNTRKLHNFLIIPGNCSCVSLLLLKLPLCVRHISYLPTFT